MLSDKKSWPNAYAARGEYYGLPDPIWEGHKIIVMSDQTWVDFGTILEGLRRTCKDQDTKLREIQAMNATLIARCNDAESRLDAVRAARKAEKRVELSYLAPINEP